MRGETHRVTALSAIPVAGLMLVVAFLIPILLTGRVALAAPGPSPGPSPSAAPATAPDPARGAAPGSGPVASPAAAPGSAPAAGPTASSGASPAPSPGGEDTSFCDMLSEPARSWCKGGNDGGGEAPRPESFLTNPLDSVAKGCADAAAWIIDKLAGAIHDTTQVDFTNEGFLRQYAVVFAASTVLTVILWLLAVTKRAVRGAPLGQAFTEAVGYLWLTVLASAFTPLALYLVVKLTDALTVAIAVGVQADTDRFLKGVSTALDPGNGALGGPIMVIFVSLLAMAAAAVLWIELLIRAAMLYVGAILGTAVYSGLVDKALWGHVRRWAALMIAIDLAKPVVVIVLGLATAVSATAGDQDAFSAVLAGLAIMFLSIFASVAIYRFVPAFGDDMVQLQTSRRAATGTGAAAMLAGPAGHIKDGIAAHADRRTKETQQAPTPASKPAADAVSAGIAAHGTRGANPPAQHTQRAMAADRPRVPSQGSDR